MSDIRSFAPLWGVWEIEPFSEDRLAIGEGNFGKVYKAVREDFGRRYECAIKHISLPQSDEEVRQLLNEQLSDDLSVASDHYRQIAEDISNEIGIMHSLRGNTNIVAYEDHLIIPKANGVGYDIFIRMELLTELSQHLKHNAFTDADAVKMGVDICTALEVCTAKNLIHRDIKPQNILINAEGNYKLGDFGISRQLEKTTSGLSKKGTYSYMAPEVYKGDDYGANVDIYSLGLLMYRLLNGNRLPFLPLAPNPVRYDDNDKAFKKRMSGEDIPAPAFANEDLSKVILKMCAFDRKERYHTATEAKADLIHVAVKLKVVPFMTLSGDHSLTDNSQCEHDFDEHPVCVDDFKSGVGFTYISLCCKKCGYETPKEKYEAEKALEEVRFDIVMCPVCQATYSTGAHQFCPECEKTNEQDNSITSDDENTISEFVDLPGLQAAPPPPPPPDAKKQKSKLVAGLLGIFFGMFGVGRFYLGHIGVGIAQLLTAGGGFLWGFIDGILILAGKVDIDRKGSKPKKNKKKRNKKKSNAVEKPLPDVASLSSGEEMKPACAFCGTINIQEALLCACCGNTLPALEEAPLPSPPLPSPSPSNSKKKKARKGSSTPPRDSKKKRSRKKTPTPPRDSKKKRSRKKSPTPPRDPKAKRSRKKSPPPPRNQKTKRPRKKTPPLPHDHKKKRTLAAAIMGLVHGLVGYIKQRKKTRSDSSPSPSSDTKKKKGRKKASQPPEAQNRKPLATTIIWGVVLGVGGIITTAKMKKAHEKSQPPPEPRQKSRKKAGLLQFIPGVGRLYLGHIGIGLLQLLTSPLYFAGWAWSIIDGILILTGKVSIDKKERKPKKKKVSAIAAPADAPHCPDEEKNTICLACGTSNNHETDSCVCCGNALAEPENKTPSPPPPHPWAASSQPPSSQPHPWAAPPNALPPQPSGHLNESPSSLPSMPPPGDKKKMAGSRNGV